MEKKVAQNLNKKQKQRNKEEEDLNEYQYCFLDLQIQSEQTLKRIVIQLNKTAQPKTCMNFQQLCSGEKGQGVRAKQLHYKGSKIHLIIPNFMLQGGDIVYSDGRGQESIYGMKFADENLTIKHCKKHLIGMVNNGPDSNGCQFYITFQPCPWLDGKNIVFGEVIEGNEYIDELEKLGQQSGKPTKEIVIKDCGVLDD